jgi:hypothetical protein
LSLLVALSAGLAWLAYDAGRGTRNGRESDLHRRWVVCQYVRQGINPYPLALAALRRAYGPLGGGREKPRVYAVPRLAADDPAAAPAASLLLAAHGAPEAVYPPSADLLLSLTLGALPQDRVHVAGVLANLALLAVLAVLLCRLPAGGASPTALGFAAAAALVLAWSPTQSAVQAGQFSILVTVSLLLAFRSLDRNEMAAGAWVAVALIKPSMALPFLILPCVRGRWRALAVAAGLHLAATCVQAVRFGCAPWDLLRQWAGVAAYFTQGQFTLQEVLSALRWADTPAGLALVAAFLGFALAWCVANSASGDAPLIDLLCAVSVLWTYHGPYDFVVLLIPLARRLLLAATPGSGRAAAWTAGAFVCVSLATSPLAYGDEVHAAARIVRHAARLVLALGLASLAAGVWRAARTAAYPPADGEKFPSSWNRRSARSASPFGGDGSGRRIGTAESGSNWVERSGAGESGVPSGTSAGTPARIGWNRQ